MTTGRLKAGQNRPKESLIFQGGFGTGL